MANIEKAGAIRTLADIESLETVPLEERFPCWDINRMIEDGCTRHLSKIAIRTFSDGDPEHELASMSYRELQQGVRRYANLFHDLSIDKGDVILCMLPIVAEAFPILLG